jgi:hypothetical protein
LCLLQHIEWNFSWHFLALHTFHHFLANTPVQLFSSLLFITCDFSGYPTRSWGAERSGERGGHTISIQRYFL